MWRALVASVAAAAAASALVAASASPSSAPVPSASPTAFPSSWPTTTLAPTSLAPSPTAFSAQPSTATPSSMPFATTAAPSAAPSTSPTSNSVIVQGSTAKPVTKSPETRSPSSHSPTRRPVPTKRPVKPAPSRTPSLPRTTKPTTHGPTKKPTHQPSAQPTQDPTPPTYSSAPTTAGPTMRPQYSKPNILFFIVDDLKPALGSFGDPVAQTPNMDALVQRGVRFTNHNVQVAYCAPSRLVLMTGLRPDQLHTYLDELGWRRRAPGAMTLPQSLRLSGYQTVGIGKVWDATVFTHAADAQSLEIDTCTPTMTSAQRETEPCGFDEYYPPIPLAHNAQCNSGASNWPGTSYTYISTGPPIWGNPNYPQSLGTQSQNSFWYDDCIATLAIGKLQQYNANPTQPFLLMVGFLRPHLPWSAPPHFFQQYNGPSARNFQQAGWISNFFASGNANYADLYPNLEFSQYSGFSSYVNGNQDNLVNSYYACASFTDYELGRVMAVLDGLTNINDNTHIVLWGDNGWHLGPRMWAKKTIFEDATRTPLAIVPSAHWLSEHPEARTNVTNVMPCETIDIFPTVMDLLGMPYPVGAGDQVGVSLLPALSNPQFAAKEAAMSQYRSNVPKQNDLYMAYALRTYRYRMIVYTVMPPPIGQKGYQPFSLALIGGLHAELYVMKPGGGGREAVNQVANPAFATIVQKMLKIFNLRTGIDQSMIQLNNVTDPQL